MSKTHIKEVSEDDIDEFLKKQVDAAITWWGDVGKKLNWSSKGKLHCRFYLDESWRYITDSVAVPSMTQNVFIDQGTDLAIPLKQLVLGASWNEAVPPPGAAAKAS